jgi:carbon monoxide dehydrogenase subunit G
MTEFISDIKTIPYSQENVYAVLSDFSNLRRMKGRVHLDQVENFSYDTDSCSFSVKSLGKIEFSIVERKPFNTVKYTTTQSPIAASLYVELKESGASETKLKLTIEADLNIFIKPVISKHLKEGVNRIADVLTDISY